MKCDRIHYDNFRNIESAELEFSPETNIFTGENAQGKTSAIEGIYLFARGKSFRGAHDREMIRFGSEFTSVTVNCSDRSRAYEMKYAFNTAGKRVCKRNGVVLGRLSEFVGYFRAVLFCPAHLAIVQSGPAARRGFLDLAISQIKPAYMVLLQKYNTVLFQRNAYIRDCRKHFTDTDKDMLEVLSVQLAECAETISAQRDKYVSALSGEAKHFMLDMTVGRDECELEYVSRKTKDEYIRELTDNLDRELRYGATLYGVHKDDIDIRIGGHNARIYASQGQQRSAALAMKLAEGELSARSFGGEHPVYLFDDVLSELDKSRREYVVSGFDGKQVFITSCTAAGLENLTQAKKFNVCGGVFK